MEEVVPIGETRGFTKGEHEAMKQEGVRLKPEVHGLLWQDHLGIVSSFFHVSDHRSWIIIEEVVPMGSSTGVYKGSPYDSTRR